MDPAIGVRVLICFSAFFRAVPVPVVGVTEIQQHVSLCRHGHKTGGISVLLIVILRLQAVSVTQRLKGSAFVVVIRSQHVLRSFRYLRQTVQRVMGVADRSSRAVGQAGQVAVPVVGVVQKGDSICGFTFQQAVFRIGILVGDPSA